MVSAAPKKVITANLSKFILNSIAIKLERLMFKKWFSKIYTLLRLLTN